MAAPIVTLGGTHRDQRDERFLLIGIYYTDIGYLPAGYPRLSYMLKLRFVCFQEVLKISGCFERN